MITARSANPAAIPFFCSCFPSSVPCPLFPTPSSRPYPSPMRIIAGEFRSQLPRHPRRQRDHAAHPRPRQANLFSPFCAGTPRTPSFFDAFAGTGARRARGPEPRRRSLRLRRERQTHRRHPSEEHRQSPRRRPGRAGDRRRPRARRWPAARAASTSSSSIRPTRSCASRSASSAWPRSSHSSSHVSIPRATPSSAHHGPSSSKCPTPRSSPPSPNVPRKIDGPRSATAPCASARARPLRGPSPPLAHPARDRADPAPAHDEDLDEADLADLASHARPPPHARTPDRELTEAEIAEMMGLPDARPLGDLMSELAPVRLEPGRSAQRRP